jgi:hypothetical protein
LAQSGHATGKHHDEKSIAIRFAIGLNDVWSHADDRKDQWAEQQD